MKLISFLASLENYQKRLWLKKKFVVESNYCITLDRVPESLYAEIAANDAQREEWVRLFAIDEIASQTAGGPSGGGKAGYSVPLTVDFLKGNPFLVLDTGFFAAEFKNRLLASVDKIDEQCDGLLVNSENFQALELLQEKYKEQVKCIYIDPPYNAKSSEILYKNTFKHASWLSLMNDRLICGKHLLTANNFVQFIAIDEIEQELLGQNISNVFSEHKKVCISIVHNPRGQQGKNISYTHEFAFAIYPNDSQKFLADVKRDEVDSRNLRDSGTESDRTDAATCFYPFLVRDHEILGIGSVPDEDYHQSRIMSFGRTALWKSGLLMTMAMKKKWRYSVTSVNQILPKLEIKRGRNNFQVIFNQDMGTMKSLWTGAKYDASEYGTKVLQSILGIEKAKDFTYPKSINTVTECIEIGTNGDKDSIILDYFAGSGTTGHAVINLNREDTHACYYDKNNSSKYGYYGLEYSRTGFYIPYRYGLGQKWRKPCGRRHKELD